MFVEKKKIGGKEYYYLRISARAGDKVKTNTVAYLGKAPMTKKEIKKSILKIPKSKIESTKKQLKEKLKEYDITKQFLIKKQLETMDGIQKDFVKKIKQLDKKLIKDMFRDFKTYYIYNSTALEGNTLSLEETNSLLNEDRSPEGKALREVYDHLNEREVFDYLLEYKPDMNSNLIIEVHAKLMQKIDNRTGNFRKHNVRVFGTEFKTSDAKYVNADMKLLMKWYNKNKRKVHPLILAAIFHEKFEKIHPFYDGNGRTGRMLMNLILLQSNFPPLIIKNQDRKKYYNVLTLGHKSDLTKTDFKHHQAIVEFCYNQLLDTFESIFSKWG